MLRNFQSVALFAALVVAAGALNAAPVTSSFTLDGRVHGLQDTSADVAVRQTAPGVWSVHAGALAVGDVLVAGIGFDTLEKVGLPDTDLTGDGVGGFSMLRVRTKDPLVIIGPGGIAIPIPGISVFSFDALPVADWSEIVDDVFGGTSLLKKSNDGTLLMIFDQSSTDFDRIAPPATLAGSAGTIVSGGSAYELWELGFTGPKVGGFVQANGAGEGWIATGPDSPSTGASSPLNVVVPFTSFTAGINRLEGTPGISFLPLATFFGGTTEFVGGGTLAGYGDGSGVPVGPWQIGDDADVSFRPFVSGIPEPASLAIWTVISLSAGAFGYRRQRQRQG